MNARVTVIGAGLQGSCTALALAKRGIKVTLVERDDDAMMQTSLRNEGKVHLGLIYAADTTRRTARRQLRGAFTFRRILSRLVGPEIDAIPISTPFTYLVSHDTLVEPEGLEEHYSDLEDTLAEMRRTDPDLDYLGTRPERLTRRMTRDELARHFDPDMHKAAFDTAELAVDTDALAEMVRTAVRRAPNIDFRTNHHVLTAERRGDGFRIEGNAPDGSFRIDAEQVVNCSWNDLYAIDRQVGVAPPPGWVQRLKYLVLGRLPEHSWHLPSATMVLGAFGDVVVRPGGLSYFSWYPAGLRGWSHDIQTPEEWMPARRGTPEPEMWHRVATELMEKVYPWYPAAREATVDRVEAGVIIAHGDTDVSDPKSGLHARTRIGVTSVDGWHSANPGKLTSAPLTAVEAADAVMVALGAQPEPAPAHVG